MLQDHRNRVFHDFRNDACRNLVCTGMLLEYMYFHFLLPAHRCEYASLVFFLELSCGWISVIYGPNIFMLLFSLFGNDGRSFH